MRLLLDAFWRSVAYCLHPKVILLSLLPVLIAAGAAALLGYLYWETAVAEVRQTLENWSLVASALTWLDSIGAQGFRAVMAPLIVVALAVPVIVVVSLLLVALMMTPAIVNLVASRRFPDLERKRGAGAVQAALWSVGCTLVALMLLAMSLPLWLVPPLVLLLPPLIWGWLTYRVLVFDVLAEHASTDERRQIMRENRWPLMGMGVVAGYLGAAPSLLWAFSATFLIFAPLILVAAVWVYTLVFAFSALWFAHFALAALHALRVPGSAPPDPWREPLPVDALPPPAPPTFTPLSPP
jgi:Etoposide-induced protein 2.4 (EI24)